MIHGCGPDLGPAADTSGHPGALPTLHHWMTFRSLAEDRPGPRWRALFEATWPAYRSWYLSHGSGARPSLELAESMLRRHMPELVEAWRRLVDLADGDPLVARMLTMYNPPAFQAGCTQAVGLSEHGPVLVRNYDYGPRLFEQVATSTSFAEARIIGTSDCLWGLLDGMNEAGLVISLAYGGQRGTGQGFGIPLVVRYLLETCDTVAALRDTLPHVPVNAAYNLTALDAAGQHVTAFVAPGRNPLFSRAPAAANHPVGRVTTRAHGLHGSLERQEAAAAVVALHRDTERMVEAFLRPPLRSTDYTEAFGTLYTAVYRPHCPGVEYWWPDSRWGHSFDAPESIHHVTLIETITPTS
jgi:predicted choloylglycine hydrolase